MLRLYLAEGEFLVDVGFGSANPPRALPLPGDEADAGQVHCVRLVDPHAGLCAVRRSGWLPLYRFDRAAVVDRLHPAQLVHLDPPAQRVPPGPEGRHNRGRPALTLADGLFGRGNGETLQRQLRDVEELLDILQTRFRLRLDPALRSAGAGAMAGRISA